jgi:phosphohistidine phosphatase
MDLILWRHAEAHDAAPGEDDLARELTPKGAKHARRMADWLNTVLPESTRVLVSPAQRTQQTAAALKRKFKTVAAIAPGASPDDLLAAARWPDAREPVLVVGHQPTIGLTISQLLGTAAHEWSVRKGAVWWLRHREREEGAEVIVVAVRAPDVP